MNLFELEELLTIGEGRFTEIAGLLQPEELDKLMEGLDSKDDKLRYQMFLLLKQRSQMDDQVYLYWDLFKSKLQSNNSYQRSLGVMLLAENVQWDTAGRMQDTIADYLKVLQDEKPITVRQCIQSLKIIVQKQPQYASAIAEALLQYDIMSVRETMRKLILTDILTTLIEIQRYDSNESISSYITMAFTGEILDKKAKKELMGLL